MRLKAVLLLTFYFIGIHCFHHKNNNENIELAEKAKQILSEIGHVIFFFVIRDLIIFIFFII